MSRYKKVVEEAVKEAVEETVAEVVEEAVKPCVPTVVANGKFQYAFCCGEWHVFNGKGQRVGKFANEQKASDFVKRSNRVL